MASDEEGDDGDGTRAAKTSIQGNTAMTIAIGVGIVMLAQSN
jgi:hypothetical protein